MGVPPVAFSYSSNGYNSANISLFAVSLREEALRQ